MPCIKVEKDEDYKRYGIVDGEVLRDGVIKMSRLVEKPGKENAPSSLATVGGSLLTPDVFDYLEGNLEKVADGDEFYLTTYGLGPMIKAGRPVYGCELKNSRYYDTGNKLGYLEAVVDTALSHPDIGDDFRALLEKRLQEG